MTRSTQLILRRLLYLCLLSLAAAPLLLTGCTFTAYEKELVVQPLDDEGLPLAPMAVLPVGDESWMQFIDFNHIVDSIVELFKHTTAKEAVRYGRHYTERKRFLHLELRRPRNREP